MEPLNHVQHGARYPDMSLYQEVVLLQLHTERVGFDYVVENVQSYYDPFYNPQKVARHYFWSNFQIPDMEMEPIGISGGFPDRDSSFDYDEHEEMMGYNLAEYDTSKQKKGKMLRNCVHPELGEHVFDAAVKNRQTTLV
jgi:DNA (cytosine-5)-methyltransferase 1